MTQVAPTPYARNLRRLMGQKGLKARPLSVRAGLGRTYVSEILSGRVVNPGAGATIRLAEILGCEPNELLKDEEAAAAPDSEHERLTRERALWAAERALGSGTGPEFAATVFRAAAMIYEVIAERESALGRPMTENDEEFWALLDAMMRRWMAERR